MISRDDLEYIHSGILDIESHLKGKKIFITGGTGLFGKWLLEAIHYLNQSCAYGVIVHSISRDPEKFLLNYPYLRQNYIKITKSDIRDDFFLPEVDYVIHGATDASQKLNDEDPEEMLDITLNGTWNLLRKIKNISAEKTLVISSGGVYGENVTGEKYLESEQGFLSLEDISSTYSHGKRISELLATIYNKQYDLNITCLRCFAFVGAYLPLNSHFVIGNFIDDVLNGRDIVIKSDGLAHRSYMYMADLVIWILKALVYGKSGEAYNVGSSEHRNLKQLAELVSKHGESDFSIRVLGEGSGTSSRKMYLPNIDKAMNDFEISSIVPLGSAIDKTITWHKKMRELSPIKYNIR